MRKSAAETQQIFQMCEHTLNWILVFGWSLTGQQQFVLLSVLGFCFFWVTFNPIYVQQRKFCCSVQKIR